MEHRMVNATLDEWLGAERPDKTTRLFLQGVRGSPQFGYLNLLSTSHPDAGQRSPR